MSMEEAIRDALLQHGVKVPLPVMNEWPLDRLKRASAWTLRMASDRPPFRVPALPKFLRRYCRWRTRRKNPGPAFPRSYRRRTPSHEWARKMARKGLWP